eukprot:COSAG03_NODE_465_length_7686_cov_24.051008_2_plen_174_part_00
MSGKGESASEAHLVALSVHAVDRSAAQPRHRLLEQLAAQAGCLEDGRYAVVLRDRQQQVMQPNVRVLRLSSQRARESHIQQRETEREREREREREKEGRAGLLQPNAVRLHQRRLQVFRGCCPGRSRLYRLHGTRGRALQPMRDLSLSGSARCRSSRWQHLRASSCALMGPAL